jgi:mycoredoxin
VAKKKVNVYGADWCSKTTRTRDHLQRRGVEFDYIDVDADPAASQWVKDQNGGKEKKPTVDVSGRILSEPSNAELDAALKATGLLQPQN